MHCLTAGAPDGIPMFFIHGNTSSSIFWAPLMQLLSPYFRIIAPDLSGFGKTEFRAIQAATAISDWSDDVMHLANHLMLSNVVVVTHSMGGIIGWDMLRRYSDRIDWLVQIAPGSPYGFGGTRDEVGNPCFQDYAGSGAGLGNRELMKALQAGCRDLSFGAASPRHLLRTAILKSGTSTVWEDELVEGMLQTRVGTDAWPGDVQPSANWPGFAPGQSGVINALSPRYLGHLTEWLNFAARRGDSASDTVDETSFQTAPTPAQRTAVVASAGLPAGRTSYPNVSWIYGDEDVLVSNNSLADVAWYGKNGMISDWPGVDVYPEQPMISQIRRFLEEYTRAGGSYKEHCIAGAGHSPHIENPAGIATLLKDQDDF